MKKIFTLFLGAFIALSAGAAPFQFGKKYAAQAPEFAAERVDAKKADVFKAPKAVKEVDSLNVVSLQEQYYAQYGVYVYILIGEDGTPFYFSFPSTGADPVVLGQTYSLSDMAADYCYYDYGGYGVYIIPFTTATFKKTMNDGFVKIEAYVSDQYEFEYQLTYDEASIPQAPQGGTFSDLEVEGSTWTDSCQYILSNDSLSFYFAFDIENLVSGQAYTESNMVAQYTGIVFNEYTIINVSTLSFVKTDGEDGAYSIAATIVDENNNTWTVSGSFVPDVSDMTFAFSADANGITVTPSNNDDAWDWFVASEDLFAQYGADGIASAVYQQYGDYYASSGAATLTFAEDLAKYFDAAGNYYLVVWGAGEKNVSTAAAYYLFVVDESMLAVENAEVAAKAVKHIENGVLVIEKNGVKYNAQGAIVK